MENMLGSIDLIYVNLGMMFSHEIGKFLMFYTGLILLMGVDMLTGFSQGKINRALSSRRMSEGFIKKGNILVLTFILTVGLPVVPVVGKGALVFVYVYLYSDELISIGENLTKMKIKIEFMQPVLKLLNKYLNEKDGH